MTQTKQITLSVKVIPKASKTKIVGFENGVLKIKLSVLPEKGKANSLLISLLSKTLNVAKSKISIISGEKSRKKRLWIEGVSHEELLQILYNELDISDPSLTRPNRSEKDQRS